MIKKLDNQNFENEILEFKGTALVDFYADWCGPCKMIDPIVEEIAEEYSDIKIGKINVDNAPQIAIKYNVISIPTLIVFKDGKEYDRIVGYTGKDSILSKLS